MNFRLQQQTAYIPAPANIRNMKDPCPVFDGRLWHLYGSTDASSYEHEVRGFSTVPSIIHLTSRSPEGPWCCEGPAYLVGIDGASVAAPGIIWDQEHCQMHMFVQTDFERLSGSIEHLVSKDGWVFERTETVLQSDPSVGEAGVYDSHPAEIGDKKYIVYSGFEQVGAPDIFLAESASGLWHGPWKRLGKIVAHENIAHHNQRQQSDYEWGLEGAQLIELPSGRVLLVCVCFLPDKPRFQRQRVFMAVADSVLGPYRSLGPVIDPLSDQWGTVENGHAAGFFFNGLLYLFYQGRNGDTGLWRYALAKFRIQEIVHQNETAANSSVV